LNVQVYPGMPDPNNGKIYHLQVGAYATREGSAFAAQTFRNAGFFAQENISGGVYLVTVVSIPASVVHLAVQKLATLGVKQIMLRE